MTSLAFVGTRGCISAHRRGARQTCVVPRAAADNQLLKKPELKREEAPQKKLFGDAPVPSSSASAATAIPGVVTIEYQRQRAKEMRTFFLEKKNEDLRVKSQVFGWTRKNEISNGRWVMFGLLVGMMTEYATGVDFIDQLKLMVTYLGIADLD